MELSVLQRRLGVFGFLVRDHLGCGVLAEAARLTYVHDAISVEAEACLAALPAVVAHGITSILVESDLSVLISALQTNEYASAPGGSIFREIKVLVQVDFANVESVFAPRACSTAAHELAQRGVN
ncbi:hypothetical protein [Oryza sativa Japonica Group]|uniref:Os01g0780100 protein n=1 Tax=Oryza sativa subsp. japonica TaxID=39947 RepID=Q5ZCE7_ORYSJ|nr:hypothetical protein [Oryza sativa Japonica Group]BAS74636.1 Os01g0780100 [Oryza sativa Japonica Group]